MGAHAESVLASTSDPDGRRVVLLERVWNEKILRGRPELSGVLDHVLSTVRRPLHSVPDPIAERRRYYQRDIGPSRWLLVVVSYEQKPARIITALGTRKDPATWTPP